MLDRNNMREKLDMFSNQQDLISEYENNLRVREDQVNQLVKTLKELKANSMHAIATKQVHEKISGLESQNQQLKMKQTFQETQLVELES